MTTLLGLNIGGTTCSAAIADPDGSITHRQDWPAHADGGPDEMIRQIVDSAKRLMRESNTTPHVVGVAIGGPLDADRGVILGPPNLPGWDDVPLRDRLQDALGLPVRVEHDAAACALAEYHWGAGRGADRLAYLTCGTGFGVGLVIDGRPYYGARGTPPEIGYLDYRAEGPIAFGKPGCFEAFASASALQRLAAWQFPGRWATQPPTPSQVSAMASEGDLDALAILTLNAQAVGSSVALLVNLLGPDTILLGSAARYLGPSWVDQVRRTAEDEAGPWTRGHFTIAPAQLADRLQDLSAVAAALRHAANPTP